MKVGKIWSEIKRISVDNISQILYAPEGATGITTLRPKLKLAR
jgi:hypothetical protein